MAYQQPLKSIIRMDECSKLYSKMIQWKKKDTALFASQFISYNLEKFLPTNHFPSIDWLVWVVDEHIQCYIRKVVIVSNFSSKRKWETQVTIKGAYPVLMCRSRGWTPAKNSNDMPQQFFDQASLA